ncbi:MAG: TM2 domain-containing protein [Phycisphaerales bacterium]
MSDTPGTPPGTPEPPPGTPATPGSPAPQEKIPGADKKILAGILGILLGFLGIHKFVLGYTVEGVIMLAVSIVGGIFTCGLVSSVVGVIGLVEGIMYLTKSDEEFVATYINGKRPWF